MKSHFSSRTLGFSLCLIITTWGCYTMLKHPHVPLQETGEQEYAVDWERVSFANDCGTCHNNDVQAFHAIAVPPPRPAPSAQWAYYYDTPWWFHYYSAPGGGSGGDTELTDEQKKRDFDRRQIAPAPESTANSVPPAAPAPPAGSVAKPVATEGEAAPAAKTSTDDSQKREGKRAIDSTESNRRTRKN